MADLLQNRATKLFTTTAIPKNNNVSKIRYNRENLISAEVADELNTYRTWSEFQAFGEIYQPEYDSEGNEVTPNDTSIGAPATRSIFNKSGAVLIGNSSYKSVKEGASNYRISHNVPLMDTPNNRLRQRNATACTVRDLVKASEEGLMGQATYSYSDFMYCKYLGLVPNTYMVTLRRFPLPVEDFISSIGIGGSIDDQSISNQYPSIGCMVTWMGTPGNELNNILKYSVSMPYEYTEIQEEDDVEGGAEKGNKTFNNIANALSASYRARYAEGMMGSSLNEYIKGNLGGSRGAQWFSKNFLNNPPYDYQQLMFTRDRNKVYGPIDVIKGLYKRGKSGLKFDQKITLTFDYEMRSYDGINQKQAFLDLLSNILNVVYSTGTFWGGGYRIVGQPQNDIFTNLKIFHTAGEGGFTGMVSSLWADAKNLFGDVGDYAKGLINNENGERQGFLQKALGLLNGIGGMLLGGFLNGLGRPHMQYVQSLLSPAPTGFWHVMIGNPRDPIMSLGNMVITNVNIEHYGPLGIDDFPTGLKVTVELDRGKPRDIRDIERMYMKGSDRIYISMGDKVLDMYKYAKEYKGSDQGTSKASDQNVELPATNPSNVSQTESGDTVVEQQTESSMNNLMSEKQILMKYFGTNVSDSIIITATEQESGSQRLKSPAGTGDQSSGGGVMAI